MIAIVGFMMCATVILCGINWLLLPAGWKARWSDILGAVVLFALGYWLIILSGV